jgi:hypothetical protein
MEKREKSLEVGIEMPEHDLNPMLFQSHLLFYYPREQVTREQIKSSNAK